MSRRTRPLTAAASAALVATVMTLVAGCGSIDPKQAPVDATAGDFCKAYARLTAADASTGRGDVEDYLKELARFGTPRGIPTAARNGFEYVIASDRRFANGAEFNALAAQQDAVGQDAAALKLYVEQICTS